MGKNGTELTPNGHNHLEAFCLMIYMCDGHPQQQKSRSAIRNTDDIKECYHTEVIWNSRDGVTPFMCYCPSCGGNMGHIAFGWDKYSPDHQLNFGQRYWRDGTLEEAIQIMERRIEQMKGTEYEADEAKREMLLKHVEDDYNGKSDPPGEFRKGFPYLDVHGYTKDMTADG